MDSLVPQSSVAPGAELGMVWPWNEVGLAMMPQTYV